MSNIKELKKPIRAFMRAHYTDERLAQLLCHARDGKLSFMSCCCFIGVATANHALQGDQGALLSGIDGKMTEHLTAARHLPGAEDAEDAFLSLWSASRHSWKDRVTQDDIRRRILIPMIRAEMKRRTAVRKPIAEIVEAR